LLGRGRKKVRDCHSSVNISQIEIGTEKLSLVCEVRKFPQPFKNLANRPIERLCPCIVEKLLHHGVFIILNFSTTAKLSSQSPTASATVNHFSRLNSAIPSRSTFPPCINAVD
jgi:hypothetical protein